MSSSDKVLFRCPVCERTFRVPVAQSDRLRCPECEKLAQAKAAEVASHREEQRLKDRSHEEDYSDHPQPGRTFGQRLKRGWTSMREQRKRTAEEETQRRQRDRDEQRARESLIPPNLRNYSSLDAVRSLMFVGSCLGLVAGGIALIAGLASQSVGQYINGLILVASSIGGIVSSELIALAINVAKDIEQGKNHVATLEQYFRYVNSRENE